MVYAMWFPRQLLDMLGVLTCAVEVCMSKTVQVVVIVVNSLWLAPFTGGMSLLVGFIALVMVLGNK